MAYQVTAGRFVGRTQELARLRQLLARATTGEPLVAVLGGEAGVGKTRLAEQLAVAAEEQGVRVLRGGCVPLGEEGLPFAPVTEALRGLAGELDPAELEAVAGPARAELGRLLPDLAWSADAAAGTAVAGAGQGRLFELLVGVVQRLAARTPLLWVLEDLAAYGQITPVAGLADIRAQIRGVLSREDEREAWAAARGIVASQFDNETVVDPYSEAIDELAERDQLRLFVMAARAPESELWADWLLCQIADRAPSTDRRGRQVLRDAAMRVKTHTPFWQNAIVTHLEGLRGWARLSDHLPHPPGALPQDAGSRAWRYFDEVIFRLERDGDHASTDTARQWSMLLGRYASAAVDVLYHLRQAAIVGSLLRPSMHDWLLRAYPDEVRRLLEWGLAHRDELTTCFPHVDTEERQQYIVRTLGQVGTTSTAVLLRSYVADPAVGGEAVTAIRQIEQRDGTLG